MKAELNVQETTPMSQEDVTKIAEENVDENGLILGKFKTQEDLIKSCLLYTSPSPRDS